MDFSYPKKEKLKKKNSIDLLFTSGKSVSKYPLRLVYVANETEDTPLKIGVSVSKKYFKSAVDRNYYKRLLRESYRLNKSLLLDNLDSKYSGMLFYQTKDTLDFETVNVKTKQLFEKLIQAINDEKNR
jgi:ribonuclease P protein component